MAPKIKSFGERIADALVEDGLLTAGQVAELLDQQKKEGTRLIKLILEKAYVSDQDLTVSMGRVLNVPPINLARVSIIPEIAELVPRDMANNHKVVPVSRLDNKLFLAMTDPLNVLALDDVRRITKLEIAPLIASENPLPTSSSLWMPPNPQWRTSSRMRKTSGMRTRTRSRPSRKPLRM